MRSILEFLINKPVNSNKTLKGNSKLLIAQYIFTVINTYRTNNKQPIIDILDEKDFHHISVNGYKTYSYNYIPDSWDEFIKIAENIAKQFKLQYIFSYNMLIVNDKQEKGYTVTFTRYKTDYSPLMFINEEIYKELVNK